MNVPRRRILLAANGHDALLVKSVAAANGQIGRDAPAGRKRHTQTRRDVECGEVAGSAKQIGAHVTNRAGQNVCFDEQSRRLGPDDSEAIVSLERSASTEIKATSWRRLVSREHPAERQAKFLT